MPGELKMLLKETISNENQNFRYYCVKHFYIDILGKSGTV